MCIRDRFKQAGKEMLPALHKALTSGDRIVRSNAARGCGAIGDALSIPHLIKALDLESGLSRASIVWALGELKAAEALPQLAALYVDARNDEQNRRGSGFRAMQSQAAITGHYDSISNLDSVSKDWDELAASLQPGPVNPRRNEELLSPKIILEAVRKIGPGSSQEFYRTLAGEKDGQARSEAAARLAEGSKDDQEKNLPILRNLLGDDERQVRIIAAVSLAILGDEAGKPAVLEWLKSTNEWEMRHTLRQLRRAIAAGKASFALERIQAIEKDLRLHPDTREGARSFLQEMQKN